MPGIAPAAVPPDAWLAHEPLPLLRVPQHVEVAPGVPLGDPELPPPLGGDHPQLWQVRHRYRLWALPI
eukprot:15431977-Alexandrium_andersonii.AAC.1